MHILEAQIHQFLDSLPNREFKIPYEDLCKFGTAAERALKKQFERGTEDFTLRMSNVGRPYCQLWHEKNKTPALKVPTHTILRNLHGDLIEAIVMFLLKAAGITILAEQQPVEVAIGGITLKGTFDVILEIEGESSVWDVKSASSWSFNNKQNFEDILKDDIYGYIPQLLLYAKGAGVKPGGWIILDKSSGEIRVTEIPESYLLQRARSRLCEIDKDINTLNLSNGFKRTFSDVEEVFYKRRTGNRILCRTCAACAFKFSCWPTIKSLPNVNSKAKEKGLVYYTHLKEDS